MVAPSEGLPPTFFAFRVPRLNGKPPRWFEANDAALAFRALRLLRLVFLDGQHFVKFIVALPADVFVKGHARTS